MASCPWCPWHNKKPGHVVHYDYRFFYSSDPRLSQCDHVILKDVQLSCRGSHLPSRCFLSMSTYFLLTGTVLSISNTPCRGRHDAVTLSGLSVSPTPVPAFPQPRVTTVVKTFPHLSGRCQGSCTASESLRGQQKYLSSGFNHSH